VLYVVQDCESVELVAKARSLLCLGGAATAGHGWWNTWW